MSIKDKNNLLPVNVWSGTDYNHHTSDQFIITDDVVATSSNEFSTNGDCSLKIIKENTGYSHVRFITVNANVNETYHGTIHILNKSSLGTYLRLIIGTDQYTDIAIPYNNSVQEISISHTSTSTAPLQFSLILRDLTNVYVDDITLTLQ